LNCLYNQNQEKFNPPIQQKLIQQKQKEKRKQKSKPSSSPS